MEIIFPSIFNTQVIVNFKTETQYWIKCECFVSFETVKVSKSDVFHDSQRQFQTFDVLIFRWNYLIFTEHCLGADLK